MFSRLHHVLNAETFTIFAFIVSFVVFALIVTRAVLMKKERIKEMSELPLKEDIRGDKEVL
jgi:hypothetical protein